MKRYLKIALGVVVLLGLSLPAMLQAQVYSEYDLPYKSAFRGDVRVQFYDITAEATSQEIYVNQFFLPPNESAIDRDNGYAKIPIGFTYDFNGSPFNEVWVNINGFITFVNSGNYPPFIPSIDPQGLFISSSSYPDNVIAPYWGNHYYRTADDNAGKTPGVDNLFTLSKIHYLNYTAADGHKILVIQWKDLNINYIDPVDAHSVTSSVATFQVILHEQIDGNTKLGDVEFAYGSAGANLNVTRESKLITYGCSIGIKGDALDFLNGLVIENNEEFIDVAPAIIADSARKSKRLSGVWQPSSGTDTTILFRSMGKYREYEKWGDGDVDFSKTKGQKHNGLPQNRFVTVNDAWLIMRSVATRQPLDSVLFRQAFHGDVNHNGRYFFDYDKMVLNPVDLQMYPTKVPLTWRDDHYSENLDNPDYSVPSLQQLYFEVNELDASLILAYMSARLPELPYTIDSVMINGRITAENAATGIEFGMPENLGNSYYNIPVYLNGNINNFAVRFDVNAEVINTVTNETDGQVVFATNGSDRVVVIGNGRFDASSPMFYVTVRTESKSIIANNVTLNEKNANDVSFNIGSIENSDNDEILAQNSPNPFNLNTTFKVSIPEEGNYTLTVFDLMGNKIKEVANGMMQSGTQVIVWDGKDAAGSKLAAGTYVYKLSGMNVSISKKLVIF